jgi:hypothetical protein
MASSSPKHALDRACIGKADDQPCNVTEDNLGPDCYEAMHAFKKIRTSTSGLRKSPNKWTKEENQKLAALVASYGEKKWKRISAEMGGQKTGAQCAQHWKRVLSPEIRKGHWDEHEEDLLLRLVIQYGSCWKKIAKKIPQRTDIQCRYQYLKAKQSREVQWDAKEDESLTKKVMEMANCNFFQNLSDKGKIASITNDNNVNNTNNTTTSTASTRNPYSPTTYGDHTMKDGADEEELSSSSGSDSREDDCSRLRSSGGRGDDDRLTSSGECGRDAWNDDKHNVNMSDSSVSSMDTTGAASSWRSSSKDTYSLSDVCANCQGSLGSHVSKIVWLEIAEHMARLKLTSTLRTALECKTRFMELLGNKISYSATSNFCLNNTENGKPFSLKNSGEIGGGGGFGSGALRGSGGVDRASTDASSRANVINNKTSATSAPNTPPNNINLTNCNNNNITINITHSYTTAASHHTSLHAQQITLPPPPTSHHSHPHSHSHPHGHASHAAQMLLAKSTLPAPLTKTPLPVPTLPSFPHLTFPHVPAATTPLKAAAIGAIGAGAGSGAGARASVASGLESLAAVASILPREMLADFNH